MARPTDYNNDILERAGLYLDSCEDQNTVVGEGKGAVIIRSVNLPTIEGLAFYLGVARSSIYLWQKSHPEFSDIIERLHQKQAAGLINNGLAGNYNPTIAKVLLTKHGYTDKQEIDQKTEHSGEIKHTIDHSKLSDAALREIASLDKPKEGQD